ncbi:TetR/AcrR family transcriptional regulator [Streptacidiphilus sp. P02-A3a]|uniref:TetR/AcrR family transcriptional regulator n=1 Tax=Streptacidiphilus sp. P02-A3a TaxID=2704468 RepID=UPI0015FAD80D|nr:TetR/AcrR family transcriptional regulator [Streptacidiphilus sp. P02-A3a]QMU69878.1 TetR/AcrR family transcriptional regulator [Streptacidiphilus sp. P02-A3a]
MAARRPVATRGGSPRAAANGGSDRRAELLRIAANLFATHGYAETTVRDIADEAGILSGSLYHHFASKEAMLDEILRDFLGRLRERFTAIEQHGGSPREVFDGLVRHAFATIDAEPEAVALYQNESPSLSGQPGFEYVDDLGRQNEAIWLRALTAGQESGVFLDSVDMQLSYRFIRDTVWSAVRWYHPGGRYQHEAVATQYLTLLYGGLLTG